MVRRIYVEKKQGFGTEAEWMLKDIKNTLEIDGLARVRIINRYDAENLSDEIFEDASRYLFAEPMVDNVYTQDTLDIDWERAIVTEMLPTEFDQRADTAMQCLILAYPDAYKPKVRAAIVYAFDGVLTDDEFDKIRGYVINPESTREGKIEIPEAFTDPEFPQRHSYIVEGFRGMDEEALLELSERLDLSVELPDLKAMQDYYIEEGRDPRSTEILVLDAYWADETADRVANTEITDIEFDHSSYSDLVKEAYDSYMNMRTTVYGVDADKHPVTLADISTIVAKYMKKNGEETDILDDPMRDSYAMSIDVDVDGQKKPWLLTFKNFANNQRTEEAPKEGAAMSLGTAFRAILSDRMIAYQAMRISGSGDPRKDYDATIPGRLPQHKIAIDSANGFSSYSNEVGIPVGKAAELYNDDYEVQHMEVSAVIGAAPASAVKFKRGNVGDPIVMIGSETTYSKKTGAEICDPIIAANIQRLFANPEASVLIKQCADCGLGGIGEASAIIAKGVEIEVTKIHTLTSGMSASDIVTSRTQDRFLVLVDKDDLDEFCRLTYEANVDYSVIGSVQNKENITLTYNGEVFCDIPYTFLVSNGAKRNINAKLGRPRNLEKLFAYPHKKLNELLSDYDCASQKGLVDRFDNAIFGGTILLPLGGRNQITPAAGMACKVPGNGTDTKTVTLMSYGTDTAISARSNFHAGVYAVLDSVTKLVSMGANYSRSKIMLRGCYPELSDEKRWGNAAEGFLGAMYAMEKLKIPCVGGQMNTAKDLGHRSVPDTFISFGIGFANSELVPTQEFKYADNQIVLVSPKKFANGMPDFESFKNNMRRVRQLALRKNIVSMNSVGKGGVFMTIVKMCAGNDIGAIIDGLSDEQLTMSDYGGIVLEIDRNEDVADMFATVDYKVIGRTTEKRTINIKNMNLVYSLNQVVKDWVAPLDEVYPIRANEQHRNKDNTIVPTVSYHKRSVVRPNISTAKPRIVIPVFPGTNCESESAGTFESLGGIVSTPMIYNLNSTRLRESLIELEKDIRNSQIIMLPGGFSGADEPEGTAKFTVSVFRNPRIREAVQDFLENRDGLILGICNGCQALIKLGLLPYGEIRELDETSPTMTYNTIGRHMSTMVRTRISSVKSPWLAGLNVGDIHTLPVTHGKGRFIAEPDILEEMIENGQIVAQYVDLDGKPTMDVTYNPNGSVMAIEALTSPDGRILGKMGHSERWSAYSMKNVPGNKDQRIFSSGINYFK